MTSTATKRTKPNLWLGVHLNGRAVILSGLVAGVIFLMLEVLTAFAFGAETPFGPAHVTLQGLVGAEGSNLGLVLAGLFVHFCLSVLVILPLAVFIHPWKTSYLVAAVGFIYGCTLYFINFMLFPVFIPLLATARDLIVLIDYALFGMMAAWFYVIIRDRAVARMPENRSSVDEGVNVITE